MSEPEKYFISYANNFEIFGVGESISAARINGKKAYHSTYGHTPYYDELKTIRADKSLFEKVSKAFCEGTSLTKGEWRIHNNKIAVIDRLEINTNLESRIHVTKCYLEACTKKEKSMWTDILLNQLAIMETLAKGQNE